jgi:hypothetical protein
VHHDERHPEKDRYPHDGERAFPKPDAPVTGADNYAMSAKIAQQRISTLDVRRVVRRRDGHRNAQRYENQVGREK